MRFALLALAFTIAACTEASPPAGTAAGSAVRAAATATPEPTTTTAPEPTATEVEGPAVVLSGATGAPGETVLVTATLERGKGEIVAISTDIRYRPRDLRVALDPRGQPLCEAAATVGLDSPVAKQLLAKERLLGDEDAMLRVALVGFDNANELPDGLLFTCKFVVPETAEPGEYSVQVTSSGAGKAAEAITVSGSDSAVVVVERGN